MLSKTLDLTEFLFTYACITRNSDTCESIRANEFTRQNFASQQAYYIIQYPGLPVHSS